MDQFVTYRQIHPWVLPLSFSRSPHPPPLAPLSPQDSVGPVSNRSSGCRPLPSLAFRWLKMNPRKISHSHSLESNNHRREFAIRDDACLWITDSPFFRMLVLLIGWGLRKARSRAVVILPLHHHMPSNLPSDIGDQDLDRKNLVEKALSSFRN